MSPKQKKAMNATYEEVRPLVEQIMRKYINTFRLTEVEQGEIRSQVGALYVHCVKTYEFGRGGSFVSYVRFQMERKLYDFITLTLRHRQTQPAFSTFDFNVDMADYDNHFMFELSEEISSDAFEVAKLFTNPPDELASRLSKDDTVSRKAISTMRNYLEDTGWAACRVAAAVSELEIFVGRRVDFSDSRKISGRVCGTPKVRHRPTWASSCA